MIKKKRNVSNEFQLIIELNVTCKPLLTLSVEISDSFNSFDR